MNEKAQLSLKEIRRGYQDALDAYNELHSPRPRERTEEAMLTPLEEGEDFGSCSVHKEVTQKVHEARKRADESGNAQVWRRGDWLEGLNEGMRARIEQALKFGF